MRPKPIIAGFLLAAVAVVFLGQLLAENRLSVEEMIGFKAREMRKQELLELAKAANSQPQTAFSSFVTNPATQTYRNHNSVIRSAGEDVPAMDKVFMCDDRCALAHFLSNHLHVILGTCDLLSEMLSQQTTDPQVMDRLLTIRAAATAMADEITKPLSRAKGAQLP